MADITPTMVNAHLGTNVFEDDGSGNATLNFSLLTGDIVGMDSPLAEGAIKLLDALSGTAVAEYDADNANDARSTYPVINRVPTTIDGDPALRVTGTAVAKVVIGDSLDEAVALS
ncbi:hypothetical protein N836_34100 [Leptolyngbya sp. Heron Island J]|uniref:hypothetical protein n=1 Tax=Leptolyngbya sp. Heron Island J TaxID=1385935 RepID=UPI0003B94F8C|nr:hypothetical protein [Leptolyngbya sp. Heron Island J]ESA37860.1 hypothetical protein N836_35155 [Leptolyngbya sp. Heron Island J]ESA38112.1 hypothetical protein N836_34100 [Leptolyngbya sp. Heron Island J]